MSRSRASLPSIPLPALCLSLCLTSGAQAGGGSPCDGDWCVSCPPIQTTPGVLLITPAGLGPSLEEMGLTLTVQLAECFGDGWVEGYPVEAITLDPASTGVVFCEPVLADHPTLADGTTTFSGSLAGGGWFRYDESAPQQLYVTISYWPQSTRIPLSIVSPDLNADLRVDLSDLGSFAIDFRNGVHDFRSDLQPDGVENLADLAVLAQHMGESCP